MQSGLLELLSSIASLYQASFSNRGSCWGVTGTLRTSQPISHFTSENSELLEDLGYPSFKFSHISIAPCGLTVSSSPILKVSMWLGYRSTHPLKAEGRKLILSPEPDGNTEGLRQQRPQLSSSACFSDREEWSDLTQCSQFHVANTKKDSAIHTKYKGLGPELRTWTCAHKPGGWSQWGCTPQESCGP